MVILAFLTPIIALTLSYNVSKLLKNRQKTTQKQPENAPIYDKNTLKLAKMLNKTPDEVLEMVESGRIKGLF